MQEALRHQTKNQIHLSSKVHATLDNFRWLAHNLAQQPTFSTRLYPSPALSSLALKMPQVWEWEVSGSQPPKRCNPATHLATPLLRLPVKDPFCGEPLSPMKNLVTQKNPTGRVTDSDLELAAGVVQNNIAAQHFDVCERSIASGSNNTPTIAWQSKGLTTTTTAPAYLLRMQAIHQCFHRYQTTSFFIPGKLNSMANNCSCLWHLTDSQLLAHFDSVYPQAAHSSPTARDSFFLDLCNAQEAARSGIVLL
jgi:hypothetical protein